MVEIWKKTSITMVHLKKNHWKTIDYDGTLPKNQCHSIVVKNWLSLCSTVFPNTYFRYFTSFCQDKIYHYDEMLVVDDYDCNTPVKWQMQSHWCYTSRSLDLLLGNRISHLKISGFYISHLKNYLSIVFLILKIIFKLYFSDNLSDSISHLEYYWQIWTLP